MQKNYLKKMNILLKPTLFRLPSAALILRFPFLTERSAILVIFIIFCYNWLKQYELSIKKKYW